MRFLLPVMLACILAPTVASAHNVGVACKVAGDKVEVEAFYDDGTDAAKAKIRVENVKQEVIATGLTDDKGKWHFKTPDPGKYILRVDAGAGHRAKTEFVVPGPAESADTISQGPTREEATRTPWLKIAIGLAAIAALSGAFFLATFFRKNGKSAGAVS